MSSFVLISLLLHLLDKLERVLMKGKRVYFLSFKKKKVGEE